MMPFSMAFLVNSVPFTRAVVNGQTSLGGSESACLGLARALQARGHDVHVFATQVSPDATGPDAAGVIWHDWDDFAPMNRYIEWDVVCSLRAWAAYAQQPIAARLRLLWNQDLLVPGQMQQGIMATAWAYDHLIYVSEYHRKQWERLQPELASIGWVTKNGFDPTQLPTSSTKDPHRIIHISRPERGLAPLLGMWPAFKAAHPQATLHLCRYSSMYDSGGWGEVCKQFDRAVDAMQAKTGGIDYLGELTKPQLYQAISDAAVMWYPGVETFAETSCIAALEAQACGTPFVGSYRGALPETCPSGALIRGTTTDAAYRAASMAAVADLMKGCATQSVAYRHRQRDGRTHSAGYAYPVLAAEWEQQLEQWFQQRYATRPAGILRQLLHEDDHVAAKVLATALIDSLPETAAHLDGVRQQHVEEARRADTFCQYVIAGKDQDATAYGAAAIQDPLKEADLSGRFQAVAPQFADCHRVLDVACGNGSFAIALARIHPTIHVYGLDYSSHNIAIATGAAARAGVGDRCHFEQVTVYDFETQTMHPEWSAWLERQGISYDGLFVGEFVEHIAACAFLIDQLEAPIDHGSPIVYTCPHGACAELVTRGIPLRRGHVHRFHHDDLKAVFGPKQDFAVFYLDTGFTPRGTSIGNWVVSYTMSPMAKAGQRPLAARIQRTRPLERLSVGILAKDAENELGRCLASIYLIADEIVIGDTGSTDSTKAIAASYGARVLDLVPIDDQLEGFAGARNAVLAACTGDWFCWIDTDEALTNGPWLRRYLDGAIYNGFVLPQTHVYLDGPPTQDVPVRVFRRRPSVQFYGCVHEQPQDGDCNTDIYPTLQLPDVRMAHLGYLSAETREDKRVSRNRPLLIKDQDVFPDRILGRVLLLREAVIEADLQRSEAGGRLTPKAQHGYRFAVQLFIAHFDDPAHKFHQIARPWYEAALQHLGIGWEHEFAAAGAQGGLKPGQSARVDRIWVRDADEYLRVLTYKLTDRAKGMIPVGFVTDPDDLLAMPAPQREAVAG